MQLSVMATPMPHCRGLFGQSRADARRQQPAFLLRVFLHAGSMTVSAVRRTWCGFSAVVESVQ